MVRLILSFIITVLLILYLITPLVKFIKSTVRKLCKSVLKAHSETKQEEEKY